jgi:branched-chain amino acid transport system ATP-binding protein
MLLKVKNLNVHYGLLQVLWNVSINVDDGELVCIVGHNGAGKTTLLMTIVGVLKPTTGEIYFDGKRIDKMPPHQIVKLGISIVPEGSINFSQMTVEENLLLGSYIYKSKDERMKNLEFVYGVFPILKERKKQMAGTLSGGEAKMLCIARALMCRPKLLLVDEPSLGLAPLAAAKTMEIIRQLNEEGITILLVEQNVQEALRMASRGYVLENGRIALEGRNLLENTHVKKAYLGI